MASIERTLGSLSLSFNKDGYKKKLDKMITELNYTPVDNLSWVTQEFSAFIPCDGQALALHDPIGVLSSSECAKLCVRSIYNTPPFIIYKDEDESHAVLEHNATTKTKIVDELKLKNRAYFITYINSDVIESLIKRTEVEIYDGYVSNDEGRYSYNITPNGIFIYATYVDEDYEAVATFILKEANKIKERLVLWKERVNEKC